MHENPADAPIISTSSSDCTAIGTKVKILPFNCKICGGSALYKYYSAVVCQPCKIFFRRNAPAGLKALKCDLDGNCEINIHNRHACSSCRLAKCFANGMLVEMIRSSRSKNPAKFLPTNDGTINEKNQLSSIHVLNLLRSDQSDLSSDQWNLISNLIHCYEEHSTVPYIEKFFQEQSNLPIKSRFKVASVSGLFESILSGIELFFKSNNDFLSLCSHDRSILLRGAMENAGSVGSILVLRQGRIFDRYSIIELVETIYGSSTSNLTKRLLDEVDRDITFVKLGIAIFVFSTTNCASYTDVGLDYLTDIKKILQIQDMYVEVTWKYLLYKYGHVQAVKCFINFIRCFFIINTALIENHQLQHHKRMVENLIEKMNQQATVND